jgi:cytosine/uracil/thiamine/allantoin permease
MNKFVSFLNTLFLVVAVIAIIVAVVDKIVGFVYFGLFPLSYLRFTEVCLGFVVAISLYRMAAQKQPQKRRKR